MASASAFSRVDVCSAIAAFCLELPDCDPEVMLWDGGGKPSARQLCRTGGTGRFSTLGLPFRQGYRCRVALGFGAFAKERTEAAARHGRCPDGSDMSKKVMIVEDNELNMKLFRDLIEASGYETVRTRDGLEALELARRHKPDLILMDIQLPEVSGLEVTKWLKEDDELHVIPVIAVTAFAMKGDEERIRQGGCEAYISKPISVPRFIETIKSYLGDA
jgi:two-component system cell cycle response regulator DivK